MDSIRDNLTKEDITAYIEAELNADMDGTLSIVLVEGSRDIMLGKKVFDKNVVFYESFSGKEGLNELLEETSIMDNRVIAVRDKDYVRMDSLSDRMFVYDESCMEMMLLKNEDILQGFFSVYCRENNSCADILYNAMRELSPYSMARKKNEEQGLGIKFSKGFGDLVGRGAVVLIDELFRRQGISDDLRDLCKREANLLEVEDLYQITNGHDICKYLGCIADDGKGRLLGEEGVRNVLICSYRKEDFKKTALYSALMEYQLRFGLQYVC